MILNPYAVLALSAAVLRLAVAVLVTGMGLLAWREGRRRLAPEARAGLEDRNYLLFSLGLLLLGLSLVSWPLLYLLLQSYVPEWPGVMCVYGVTRVGTGSSNASRFLPGLLQALQLTKPALVFLGGAWFALYLVNRRTQTAPLTNRVVAALVAVGLLAGGDAAAEAAYLLIPKKEEFASVGCCAPAFDGPGHGTGLAPNAVLGPGDRPLLSAAYFACNAGMVLGLSAAAVRARVAVPRLAPLAAAAAGTLAVGAVFLVEVASPVLLRLPFHHCPYDLIPAVPEAVLGAALFVGGAFAVGWAWVAGRWGDCPESRLYLPAAVGALLRAGLFCYLGSLVVITVGLALA